jgi:hypothetical protein
MEDIPDDDTLTSNTEISTVTVSHYFQFYLICSPYEPYNLGWYVSVLILYV